MKTIFYFHGYGSNANTEKVKLLKRCKNAEVLATNIDIDPSVSIPELMAFIDMELLARFNDPDPVMFVGTSLGGWYAKHLAEIYKAKCVIINPCYDPKNMLEKYGVPEEIRNKYEPLDVTNNDTKTTYFLAQDDDQINYTNLKINMITKDCQSSVLSFTEGGHRFNGPVFDHVIHFINGINR